MPRYVYRCLSCEGHFQSWHGINESKDECDLCSIKDHLIRVPQIPSIKSRPVKEKHKVGSLTKEYIEQNQELLKEMKKEAGDNFYDS
tara:strand:+ start:70 stop:330 length:261 start_codon:yes stop_codon:yes gene_type:complete